jgi:CTP:molybdopterin cytidylyltransferase MocA
MAARLGNVVLLAGGASSRMGVPKGLVRTGARLWIEHQLDVTNRVGAGKTILVLGAEHERYTAEIADLEARAFVAINPAPERGPFASLQCGLAHVAGDEPTFVLPIDVPAPAEHVWASLRAALDPAIDATVPVHEGRGGHPVLLSPGLVHRLLRLDTETRLDFELRSCAVVRVPVDDARVRCNLNTVEDWDDFARRSGTDRGSGP